MTKKRKFYVVWVGKSPGIYDNWADCKSQIEGFPNAKYKAFETEKGAAEAFRAGVPDSVVSNSRSEVKQKLSAPAEVLTSQSIAVDAACSGNPGRMEYRGVYIPTGKQLFHQGPFDDATNNIGEFLALVHVLAMLKSKNDTKTVVYTDSRTALSWVKNRKIKTTLEQTGKNRVVFELLHRAVDWIQSNTYSTVIKKWDTENWGEIPADFGRK